MRLVQPELPFTHQSKVSRCADQVFDIWSATTAQKATQLVFCDSSTPKPEFNLYDELRRILITEGVPADEIAFVHDAEAESVLGRQVVRGPEMLTADGETSMGMDEAGVLTMEMNGFSALIQLINMYGA